jgi:hypothetical protein
MLSLATVATATAAPNDGGADTRPRRVSEANTSEEAESAATQPDSKSATIAYAAFSDAINRAPEDIAVETAPATPAPPKPEVSTAPMSVGEKFSYFARTAFVPPGPYASAVANGMFKELLDNNEGKKDTFGDYLADSMTRAARSFAFSTTSKFFERFAYPSLFRQDPRYHRSGKEGAGARIGYAVSRLFVTRGDRGGSQINVSYLLGGATAAAISNVWVRDEHRNTKDSFIRWGNHMAFTAAGHILKEFLGGQ